MSDKGIIVSKRYYPRLPDIVTVNDLPEYLSFVQEGLTTIFDRYIIKTPSLA